MVEMHGENDRTQHCSMTGRSIRDAGAWDVERIEPQV